MDPVTTVTVTIHFAGATTYLSASWHESDPSGAYVHYAGHRPQPVALQLARAALCDAVTRICPGAVAAIERSTFTQAQAANADFLTHR